MLLKMKGKESMIVRSGGAYNLTVSPSSALLVVPSRLLLPSALLG